MSIRIFGSGGGVITDATATANDVVSGKVFYNNDGRIEGTLHLQDYLRKKSIVLPPITNFTDSKSFDIRSRFRISDNGELFNNFWGTGTSTIYYAASFKIGYKALIGFKVNGTLIEAYIDGKLSTPCEYTITKADGNYIKTLLSVYFLKGTVYYSYATSNTYAIECFYI